jgi:hypothetical protein
MLSRDFLAEHPNVYIHYTATYSSWLNQVEFVRVIAAFGDFLDIIDSDRAGVVLLL